MAILLAAACQPPRPSYVLDNGDMEDLLYDLHRAHFTFVNSNDSRQDGAQQYAMFLRVLEKHKVKPAEWDSSMVYYCCHADQLEDIYKDLAERLEREAEAVGAAVSAGSDTTNIWRGEQSMVLTSYQPYTTRQWSLPNDSLIDAGERITLRFTGLFLQPGEEMRAECVLAIRLQNDSVISTSQTLNRTGIYNISLTDNESLGIKEVKGMFMMRRGNLMGITASSGGKSSQILCVKDIVLLHESQKQTKPKTEPDGVQHMEHDMTQESSSAVQGQHPPMPPPTAPADRPLNIQRAQDEVKPLQ